MALVELATEKYECLPEELRERLNQRGRSWVEMVELLAYFRIKKRERDAKAKPQPQGSITTSGTAATWSLRAMRPKPQTAKPHDG